MVNKWLDFDLFSLPHYCSLCSASTNSARELCHACEGELPWLDKACPQCGIELPDSIDGQVCGACLSKTPPFSRCIAPFRYEFPIRELINAIKFNGQLRYSKLLSELLLEQLLATYQHTSLPECLIPVPLHWRRLQQRGFNQAQQIARPIARGLGIPIKPGLVKRARLTTSQQSLDRKQRLKNLRGAFTAKLPFPYQRVALVDDVFTTGVTLTELSNTLKKAGVKEIHCWCLARTLKHD
jgi:ComF family protein